VSLFVGAMVLVLSGTAVWSSTGGDSNADSSWQQSMWMSWGLFFDPGTQTGVAADAPLNVKLAAVVFSVLGFLYNLTFLGIIVEWIRSSMDTWTRTQSRVWYGNHILVLGWSEKTLYLLNELFEALHTKRQRHAVVVLADRNQAEMHQEVHQYFLQLWEHLSFFDRRWRMLNWLSLREGLAHDTDALERAGAGRAEEIIVLSRDGDPRTADLETIRTMVALSSLRQQVSCRIFAEVQVQEVGKVLRRLHARTEVIHARAASNHVLSMLTANQLVGGCIADLCSFAAGDELYVVDRHEKWYTFGDACRAFDRAVCIGVQATESVKHSHGTRIELAPADDRPLLAGERLLVIASEWKDVQVHFGRLWHWRSANPVPSPATTLMAGSMAIFLKDTRPMAEAEEKEEAARTIPPIVIIGWPADLPDILIMLDSQVAKGSQLHILSERIESKRQGAFAGRHQPVNMDITHHYGPRTSGKMLRLLPLREASAVLILAELKGIAPDSLEEMDEADVGDDTLTSDSSCLASLLVVADILDQKDVKSGPSQAFELCRANSVAEILSFPIRKTKIICEVLDPRTEQVVARNQLLQNSAYFFRSKALETGIFMMAMSEPAVFNALMVLMSPSCPSLQAVPVSKFVSPTTATGPNHGVLGRRSWRELNDAVRACGGLLLGAPQRSEVGSCEVGSRIQLTAWSNKDEQFLWHADDMLLVILPPQWP